MNSSSNGRSPRSTMASWYTRAARAAMLAPWPPTGSLVTAVSPIARTFAPDGSVPTGCRTIGVIRPCSISVGATGRALSSNVACQG